jgi:hypothetical protein
VGIIIINNSSGSSSSRWSAGEVPVGVHDPFFQGHGILTLHIVASLPLHHINLRKIK